MLLIRELLLFASVFGEKLPKFIITGVSKCGTTAARSFLRAHPSVAGAEREPYFFNDHYDEGLDWYQSFFPDVEDDTIILYEKSPSYYKSYDAIDRIWAMNSTIKTINIVCDNVRRTLSRYLHIQHGYVGHGYGNLDGFGDTIEAFEVNLGKVIDAYSAFLDDLKRDEGNGTVAGLVESLYKRWQIEEYPFGNFKKMPQQTKLINQILTSGLYPVYNRRWAEVFPAEQLLTINGNLFASEPWVPLKEIQDFIGVEEHLGEQNFTSCPGTGLPGFIQDGAAKCLPDQKGRTIGQSFSPQMTLRLRNFYQPFDQYFAETLGRNYFDWNFGADIIQSADNKL